MAFQPFLELPDTHPALAHSPMMRGLTKTFDYLAERSAIGLTPSGAFKRVFVQWAAEAFNWPGYRSADLYALNKVLNEWDFPPLAELHDLMLALRIGRHFKGHFRLTPAGRTFVGHPGRLFGLLVPFYLFSVDHERNARFKEKPLLGNWDIFLNVINVEADGGLTVKWLREVLYGSPEANQGYDQIAGSLFLQVIRPLCWLGLLQTVGKEKKLRDHVYVKTPLWHAALRLDTDIARRQQVRH